MGLFSRKKINQEPSLTQEDVLLRTYSTHLTNVQNYYEELQLLTTQIKSLSDDEIIRNIQQVRKKLIVIKQSHEILLKRSSKEHLDFKRKSSKTYDSSRYSYTKLSFYLPIKILNQRSNVDRALFSSFITINFEILSSYYTELKDFVGFISQK